MAQISSVLGAKKTASFRFSVNVDSMMNAGIVERDKVMVGRLVNTKSKEVVAAVANDEYNLKRFYQIAAKVGWRL